MPKVYNSPDNRVSLTVHNRSDQAVYLQCRLYDITAEVPTETVCDTTAWKHAFAIKDVHFQEIAIGDGSVDCYITLVAEDNSRDVWRMNLPSSFNENAPFPRIQACSDDPALTHVGYRSGLDLNNQGVLMGMVPFYYTPGDVVVTPTGVTAEEFLYVERLSLRLRGLGYYQPQPFMMFDMPGAPIEDDQNTEHQVNLDGDVEDSTGESLDTTGQ